MERRQADGSVSSEREVRALWEALRSAVQLTASPLVSAAGLGIWTVRGETGALPWLARPARGREPGEAPRLEEADGSGAATLPDAMSLNAGLEDLLLQMPIQQPDWGEAQSEKADAVAEVAAHRKHCRRV